MDNNNKNFSQVNRTAQYCNTESASPDYYYAVSSRNGLGVFDDRDRLMRTEGYIHQGFCCRKFISYAEAKNACIADFLFWPENQVYENIIPPKFINNFFYWKHRFHGNEKLQQNSGDLTIIYRKVEPKQLTADFSEILG